MQIIAVVMYYVTSTKTMTKMMMIMTVRITDDIKG